jgi:hypothetical protein
MSPSDPPVALLQQRQALVKQLRQLEPFILWGSLIERFKRCGKPGCKCAQGPGHGPRSEFALSMLSPGFGAVDPDTEDESQTASQVRNNMLATAQNRAPEVTGGRAFAGCWNNMTFCLWGRGV